MTIDAAGLPVLLTETEVAQWLGMSTESLRADRARGVGLPFIKLGLRRIRYSADDVRDYLTARTVVPRATPGSAAAQGR
ncbi:UNVERIFIED_CONTAM: hypothetical protein DES50_102689 [Williamsia faeni]